MGDDFEEVHSSGPIPQDLQDHSDMLKAHMEWRRSGHDEKNIPTFFINRIKTECERINRENIRNVVFWLVVVWACSYYFGKTGVICSLVAWVIFSAINSYIGVKRLIRTVGLPYSTISRIRRENRV